jgi:hypothetical protein
MQIKPLAKAVILGVLGLGLARALLVHDGVGVVEWVVGCAVVAALGAGSVHFARRSLARSCR